MIERSKSKKEFKENLSNAIKDAGQELINMAEDVACDADKNLISKVTITVSFDPEQCTMQLPLINIEKGYLCKAAIDRFNQQCY